LLAKEIRELKARTGFIAYADEAALERNYFRLSAAHVEFAVPAQALDREQRDAAR
jgi:hypothetical protein